MKFSKLYQLVLESKLEDELEKNFPKSTDVNVYDRISEDRINIRKIEFIKAVNSQLTNKHKWVDYLVKNVKNYEISTDFIRDNVANIVKIINLVDLHWNELEAKEKDLQHMNPEKLYDLFLKIEAKAADKSFVNKWQKLVDEAKDDVEVDVIKLTEEYVILRPLNYNAANRYGTYGGANSWCIVADSSHFNRYSKENVFYFILFKDIPSDKKKNPWFKTCIQRMCIDEEGNDCRNRYTAWNFFDEAKNAEKVLQELKIDESYFETFEFIKNSSEEKQKIVLEHCGRAIQYIDNPSKLFQIIAITRSPFAIQYIKNPSEELQKIAITKGTASAIKYISNPSEEIKKFAVETYPESVQYIKNPSEEVQLLAVAKYGSMIYYIPEKIRTEKVKLAAVKRDPVAIQYIAILQKKFN